MAEITAETHKRAYRTYVAAAETLHRMDGASEIVKRCHDMAGRKAEEYYQSLQYAMRDDGGPGSGNWGHAGRPGHRGGSAPGGGKANRLSTPDGSYTSRSQAEKENKQKTAPAKHRRVNSTEFVKALAEAKETCDSRKRWRVDSERKPEDFDAEGVKTYVTEHGSTFAIKPDGDIISVCKNRTEKPDGTHDSGKRIMAAAVQRGGTHLDSYAGNYTFYTRCGFEVVSRCEFDEKFAPPGWTKGKDKPEDIYFMKHVGIGKVRDADEDAMLERVLYSKDYSAAEEALRQNMEKGMGRDG